MEEPAGTSQGQPAADPGSEALFSLVAGEGDGLMLGLAAGDTAGGAWELGYSAVTEQATVIAYQLIEHRRLHADLLVGALRELDGSDDEEPVYRAETPHFRGWLDRVAASVPLVGGEPSADSMPRAAPLGVVFRRDPDAVVGESIALGRLFHPDAGSVAAGVIAASAVAASCFAQSGIDLVAGVAEAVVPAGEMIASGLSGAERLETLESEFAAVADAVGVVEGQHAMELVGGDAGDPVQMALAGLLLAAPLTDPIHVPVEQAARIGGSVLGATVGAMVGARAGIRAWPWVFANDTWFAEIGRRLARGPDEVSDLPIPYAVEQHLISGARPGIH